MSTRDNSKNTADRIVNSFSEQAMLRGEALRSADAKRANKHFDQMISLVHEADSSRIGRTPFLQLLKSENIDVQVSAASVVLNLAPSEAIPVLEAAAARNAGAVSMSASMILAQWREGSFRFP